MHNSNFMNVLDPWDELVEHSSSLQFIDPLALDDVVEQFSPFHELHHQKKLFRGFDQFVELDDIGVTDQV